MLPDPLPSNVASISFPTHYLATRRTSKLIELLAPSNMFGRNKLSSAHSAMFSISQYERTSGGREVPIGVANALALRAMVDLHIFRPRAYELA